ncbi:hypothetical protein CV102_23710 [Natronococcus pandeyae]|uniref:Uncharacterized protein n=1 Tax=Natronococcus pandeyae TaxID=2055836 RepID=A0A8J8TN04_9EURY|nr:hypothetical protein CV102_23710 [Natronococcus pandeyae]
MNVYAPTENPLVVVAGDEIKNQVIDTLKQLFGAVSILGLFSYMMNIKKRATIYCCLKEMVGIYELQI